MGLKTESDTMRGNSMGDEIQIRDTRDGGWFWADNELIDHYGETIGVHGIAVYMALARYANNNKCWPSIGTICKKIGVSRPTVTKALNKLKAAGLISVQHRMTAEGDSDSNLYTLERIKVGRQGDLLRVGKEVGDGRQGGLHKQDLPNKTNSNNFGEGKAPSPSGGGKAPPPELPSKTTTARKTNGSMTPAGKEFFAQFGRKRWATPQQQETFEETEKEVGATAMLAAVKWAAENGIAKVPAICKTAKKIAGQDNGAVKLRF